MHTVKNPIRSAWFFATLLILWCWRVAHYGLPIPFNVTAILLMVTSFIWAASFLIFSSRLQQSRILQLLFPIFLYHHFFPPVTSSRPQKWGGGGKGSTPSISWELILGWPPNPLLQTMSRAAIKIRLSVWQRTDISQLCFCRRLTPLVCLSSDQHHWHQLILGSVTEYSGSPTRYALDIDSIASAFCLKISQFNSWCAITHSSEILK